MILMVSGRTDIIAFYSTWFMNRLKEGFIDVRNPFNKKLVSRININNVDLIFFCTKNPLPIVDKLQDINTVGFYAYGNYIRFYPHTVHERRIL